MVKYELVRGDISEWRPFNRSHHIWHGSRAGVHTRENSLTEQLRPGLAVQVAH